MRSRAEDLTDRLQLQPHPEGGFYREVHRSTQSVEPADGRPTRQALTAIYFLLAAGQHSRWHQLASDEVWHYYEGDPLELLCLNPETQGLHRAVLGPVGEEQAPVAVVPAGYWQAARPLGAYTLAGCSVGPGFDFADFTLLADHADAARRMRTHFPDVAALI